MLHVGRNLLLARAFGLAVLQGRVFFMDAFLRHGAHTLFHLRVRLKEGKQWSYFCGGDISQSGLLQGEGWSRYTSCCSQTEAIQTEIMFSVTQLIHPERVSLEIKGIQGKNKSGLWAENSLLFSCFSWYCAKVLNHLLFLYSKQLELVLMHVVLIISSPHFVNSFHCFCFWTSVFQFISEHDTWKTMRS